MNWQDNAAVQEPTKPARVSDAEWRRLKATLDTAYLERHLTAASGAAIRTALLACGDWVTTATSSGQALELLAKAVVFRRDPTALARVNKERRQAVAAFLSGEGHQEVWSLADITTITAPDAVKTAYQLLAEPLDTTWSEYVFFARNRAVHLAQAEPETALRSLVHCLYLAKPLLADLSLSADDWIDHDQGLVEVAEAAVAVVNGKRWNMTFKVTAFASRRRAQDEWADICERFPEDVLTELGANPRVRPDAEHVHMSLCPTGGHYAWFEVDVEESEVQDSEEDIEYEVFRASLECPLCGLEAGFYELEALGLGGVIERRYSPRE